jgi:acid phosphatase
VAVEAARTYLTTIEAGNDGLDLVVLDIDETALSNMPYYVENHYGVDAWNETLWNGWVNNASAPALDAMLSLYTDLRAQNWSFAFITGRPESQREQTAQNLAAAGYSDWATLVLRAPEERSLTAVEYKSKYRRMLEEDGYRIRSSLGDQWSDLAGGDAGDRTFKLPNPMYYIY